MTQTALNPGFHDAALGAALFLEIEQSFETVSGIVDEYGVMTLVDLWWLANVLVANPEEKIIQSPDSRLCELIALLPSAPSFARYIILDDWISQP